MAARNIRNAEPAERRRIANPAAWDWATDFARQQVVVATESASTMVRGFESMRRIQQQTAQEAAARHATAGLKLRSHCTPLELVAVQGELLRSDVEAATRCWQQLAGVAMETTTELLACGARLVDTEDVLAALSPRFLHS